MIVLSQFLCEDHFFLKNLGSQNFRNASKIENKIKNSLRYFESDLAFIYFLNFLFYFLIKTIKIGKKQQKKRSSSKKFFERKIFCATIGLTLDLENWAASPPPPPPPAADRLLIC